MRLLKYITAMLLVFLLAAGSLNAAGPVLAAESSDAAVSVSKVTVTFNGDPKTSKGFTWYTPKASQDSDVQVIEATYGKAEFDTGLTFKGITQVSTNSPLENVHKAEATGLKADTAYYFRVGDAALNVWSEAGTFKTAPAGGAFTFIDLADTQAKSEDEAILSSETLVKALATVPDADFVVHNGDIVDNGIKEEQWNWLLGHSRQSLLNTTIVPAAGNHEDENNAFIEHFDIKPAAGSATETGAYYSYDYSNAHFVVLNTNENSEEYADFSKDQVEWLKSDVKAAKAAGAQWIIVNIHKGPYTTSNHATDTDIMGPNGVRTKIAPLMAELDIDFVLQGHDHIYARTKPIKSDNTAAATAKFIESQNGKSVEYTVNPDGTIYLIPATAGPKVYYKNQKEALGDKYYNLFERAEENHAAKYGPDPSDATRPKRSQVQNFVGITIDGGKLTAYTYEIDQNVDNAAPYLVDQFGIQKDVGVSKVTVTFNGDPKTSKGFTWYTPKASQDSDVQVIEATYGKAEFDTGLTFKGITQVSTNSPLENVHKAEATGLKADTAYYFRVGDAALNVWSEAGTFKTAPAGGAFTFIDLADTQAKSEDEAILSSETLAKALAAVPDADFVVHNGDIVDNGIKEEQWNWLLGHSRQSLLNTTIVPAAGNHEDENNAFIEHFDIKPAAGSATETGAYYSYDYSNAHFVVLNSNENSEEYADFSNAQVEWLKSDVKAAKAAGAQWIIVNIHKGPYTTSNHATDTDIMGPNGVRTKIAPLMAELDIDFVLQGHDHIYARTKPIKSDNTAAATAKFIESQNGKSVEYTVNPDGTIYLIPATAGPKVYYKNQKPELGDKYYDLFERAEENHAAKYGPDPSDATRPKRSQVQNFVGITIDGGKLTAFTYEIDQNVDSGAPYLVDQFGIQKVSSTGNSGGTPSNTGGGGTKPTVPATPPTAPTTPTAPAVPTAPTAPATKLKDIGGHWAAAAINKAVELGFAKGYADGTFRPNQTVNRAEFITLLMRAVKHTDTGKALGFKDAGKIPAWSQSFIAQALDAGIIAGYNDNTFRPDQVITRAEMAAMIVRAGGVQVNPKAVLSFADAKDAPKWAVPYIAAIKDAGLVNGIGQNRFAPNQRVTRAEAVTVILGLLQRAQ
ncbi:S-layer homology domain-containing protein [Paenibacillus durus]|uniref:S-layer homology domain-containing protein n=1 Tax=Paenibacillus durus TaxID=44251 RepID=UPI0009DF233C|nr:S-layer homology domain-containing protein [Paenibacillus durus]